MRVSTAQDGSVGPHLQRLNMWAKWRTGGLRTRVSLCVHPQAVYSPLSEVCPVISFLYVYCYNVKEPRAHCVGRKLNRAIVPSWLSLLRRKMRCERSGRMATSPSKTLNLITGLALALQFQLGFIKTVYGESCSQTRIWKCCCLREEQPVREGSAGVTCS